MAYLCPAIIADVILGAYGDRHGRKTVLLLGLSGLALAETGFLLTLSQSAATPYWTTLIFSAVAGTTGFVAMIPVSCNAYLADTSSSASQLTIRSGIFSATQMAGSIIGAFAAAGLSKKFSIPVAIDVELFLFLLATLFTLWRIPQRPGLSEIERRTQVRAIRPIDGVPKKSPSLAQRVHTFLADMGDLMISGINIYRKPREGYRRAFLFISAFVFMLSLTTAIETRTSGLINSFVFRRTGHGHLGWTATELGLWNGCGYAFLLVGTLSGLYLFKKVFKLRETTIIIIGLSSSCLRTLLIACSLSDWMMFVANGIGLFSGLVQPAVVSFLTQVVPSSEIGRAFSLFGIGSDVAMAVSTLVYANIYRATVPWAPSFLFYLLAGIQLFAVLLMIWVDRKARELGIERAQTTDRRNTSVQSAISRIGEVAAVENGNGLNKKNGSKPKLGHRQVSIIQHAEELNRRSEGPLWESMEDLRAQRGGAYGDRHGRKTVLLLGLSGLALAETGFLLTLSQSAATPYWTTLIFSAVAGTTGFVAMIPVSCNAYLADTSSSASQLTIRSGIFSATQMAGSIIGAFAAAGLSKKFSIPVAVDVELFLFLLATLFTLWRIPQRPGLSEIERRTQVRAIRPIDGVPKKSPSLAQRVHTFLADMGDLMISGINIYRKPREGYRRAFLLISAFVFMLSLTTAIETRTSGLINSFVFRRAGHGHLGWTATELGLWNGCGYAFLLVGTLSGLYLFKKVLKLRETTIIIIGLSSSCLRTLLIACSLSDWMMFVANGIGLFSGLVQPAVVSFLTQVVPSSEIGRAFSLFGIGSDVAMAVSTLVYANIYRATVPWAPSFLFYLLAGIQLFAVLLMIWVDRKARELGIERAQTTDRRNTSVQSAISRIGEVAAVENGNGLKKKNGSKPKLGHRQVSIIQHAEELNRRSEGPLWESMEDLRAQRGGANFY